ncbi:MAG: type IV pilus assembly protein PilM, partial [Kiritimatiellaeota bacterium]|nr:type IV pilus assembly protein PilM [Kiritimatiellota bacterium]
MAKTQNVLALDIGATSIKAGLFEYPPQGRIALVGYSYKEYDEELTEDNRTIMVAGLLREMLLETGFTCRKALVSISGQSAFIRFVKLPPVADDENRVRQIVEFEARQNVPFPIEQVIWDYQLLSKPEMDAELEVMFVVIKNEIVQQITAAVQAVGLDPVTLDVGPIASYNAARANHIGDDECAMILNIGGRSTSLLFADRQRFFARTIPIAGHSITQQIAKEFGIGFDEAEELKRRHGFVALGGAYEEPESEVAAAVSKIVRNVMARLHGEINRSVSVYRAQHKGQRPTRLYLAGGSSIMAFTDHFFAEKLRMEVSYLNPFQVMELGPSVNRRELQEVAHTFSEVVGLGLRYRLECPVEISLVPESIVRQQALRRKKPYLFACAACILLLLFVTMLAIERKAGMYQTYHREVEGKIGSLQELANEINAAQSDTETVKAAYDSIQKFIERRYTWPRILNEIQRLRPPDVWIESIKPLAQVPPAPEGGGMGMGAPGGAPAGAGGMGMGMGAA